MKIEIEGNLDIDVFALSARVIEIWLAPPRPVELEQPGPMNLRGLLGDPVSAATGGVCLDPAVERPTWDATAREIRWGKVVLKRFRQPAGNQTTILAAFQEDGWTSVIDDPLAGGDVVASKRLGGTVRALNMDMLVPGVVRFERDGTGEGVRWVRKP